VKAAALIAVTWLIVGLALLSVNAACSGDNCSDSAWWASLLGLIAWGLIGVPVVLGTVFVLLDRILRKAPR
jgi:hypothetical protein